jgi:hypothetical protein
MQEGDAFKESVNKIISSSTEHWQACQSGEDTFYKNESNFYKNYETKQCVHEEWTLKFNGDEDDGVER